VILSFTILSSFSGSDGRIADILSFVAGTIPRCPAPRPEAKVRW
jgi:hypothetical protein